MAGSSLPPAATPAPALDAIDTIDAPSLAARRHPFTAIVAHRLRRRAGVAPGQTVVIGTSGGADSLSLLTACVCLRARTEDGMPAVRPIAAHVHHHLRGEDADEDARHVEQLCRRWDVPFEIRHVHPGRGAGASNVAAEARALRYQALADVARERGAAHVATAHHADDQLETMLMALARGAGPRGLAAMRWRRDLAPGIGLIRPLLDVEAATCAAYCEGAGITWRDDPSNADPSSRRAALRHDVLPRLERLWPGCAGRAADAADRLGTAADALETRLAILFGAASTRGWPREDLAALPPPVVAAGLHRALVDWSGNWAGDGQPATPTGRDLLAAAEIITDTGETRPRELDWPGPLALRITTREVRVITGETNDA